MDKPHLPLNALRAFEASARHLSFTRAALELCVTQAAVSHHVKRLEERLGTALFRRLPRGLALTDEGAALVPVVADSFARIGDMLDRFADGRFREVLTLGVVGTFAVGWLMPRLAGFREAHPEIDLRLMTNNNRVDLAGEGLDFAIRFGDGAWHGTEADRLFDTPFAPLCSPGLAARIATPADLARETLLRSYRADEWTDWFAAAGIPAPTIRGPVFDSSLTMALAAEAGAGVALLPVEMFVRQLGEGSLARPLDIEAVTGGYWLTRLKTRASSPAMLQFRDWLLVQAASG
ncbi:LysR family transcriptional regulator [Sphingomonas sp. LaA6.9]|uniref:LysR family transcriptional regulator n=1 Tax=Sphingomonas sp. LaA6.9 TaxID=2919914 RepID=UPI001F4FA7D9|nr:LysR family transcriptional regulator [Sphingomonas sp. LaA6.9]MCJ8156970.1 LysR family transcriptional regulator [Sphingomonas sp. LaA6.9]